MRAGAGHAAGQDLRAVGNIPAQTRDILVIDRLHTVDAKAAYLFAALPAAIRPLGPFGFFHDGMNLPFFTIQKSGCGGFFRTEDRRRRRQAR